MYQCYVFKSVFRLLRYSLFSQYFTAWLAHQQRRPMLDDDTSSSNFMRFFRVLLSAGDNEISN